MQSEEYILTQGIVVDINDLEQKGKIKVQILPELQGVSIENLPWAIPFTSMQGASTQSNLLPEKESLVRILVRKDWQRFYYLGNYFFESKFDFSAIVSKLVGAGVSSTYKDINFTLFEDGSLQFQNRSNGESGYIHSSGSYSVFKSNGDIVNYTSATSKVTTEGGQVELTANTNLTIAGLNISITGVNGVGMLQTNGVVAPTGTGPYCGLPFCVMTGAPQSGSQVVLT